MPRLVGWLLIFVSTVISCPQLHGVYHENFGPYSIPDGKMITLKVKDKLHFIAHSLNNTFEDAVCEMIPDKAMNSSQFCHANCTLSSVGKVTGFVTAMEVIWQIPAPAPGQPPTAFYWLPGAIPPPPPACVFNNSIYHDLMEEPTTTPGVYVLNTVDQHHVTIHAVNSTFKDTTATLGPGGFQSNVSAFFSNVGKTVQGILQNAHGECEFIWGKEPRPAFIWARGPLPPPPPPPPSPCTDLFNKSACNAFKPVSRASKGCSWCQSSDGIHSLCYDLATVPKLNTTEWRCDKKTTH